jgi:hypothetical protein
VLQSLVQYSVVACININSGFLENEEQWYLRWSRGSEPFQHEGYVNANQILHSFLYHRLSIKLSRLLRVMVIATT